MTGALPLDGVSVVDLTHALILVHPHVRARGTLEEVEVPDLNRSIHVVGAGFRFEHDQPGFRGGVPRLGEHTAVVLAELGLSADE